MTYIKIHPLPFGNLWGSKLGHHRSGDRRICESAIEMDREQVLLAQYKTHQRKNIRTWAWGALLLSRRQTKIEKKMLHE